MSACILMQFIPSFHYLSLERKQNIACKSTMNLISIYGWFY